MQARTSAGQLTSKLQSADDGDTTFNYETNSRCEVFSSIVDVLRILLRGDLIRFWLVFDGQNAPFDAEQFAHTKL